MYGVPVCVLLGVRSRLLAVRVLHLVRPLMILVPEIDRPTKPVRQ